MSSAGCPQIIPTEYSSILPGSDGSVATLLGLWCPASAAIVTTLQPPPSPLSNDVDLRSQVAVTQEAKKWSLIRIKTSHENVVKISPSDLIRGEINQSR